MNKNKLVCFVILVCTFLFIGSVETIQAGCCYGNSCEDVQICTGVQCSTNADCMPCFPSGIKVEMGKGGLKDIEDVKVGEKVVSQNESGVKSISTVNEVAQKVSDHLCQINFKDGDNLRLTRNHSMFTPGGWKAVNPTEAMMEVKGLEVSLLKQGDSILTSNGNYSEVESIACWSEKIKTYNLILDGNSNTYFADGYLAHNKKAGFQCPAGQEMVHTGTYHQKLPTQTCWDVCDQGGCETFCDTVNPPYNGWCYTFDECADAQGYPTVYAGFCTAVGTGKGLFSCEKVLCQAPAASCTVNLSPAGVNTITAGGSIKYTANVTKTNNGGVQRLVFRSSNGSVAVFSNNATAYPYPTSGGNFSPTKTAPPIFTRSVIVTSKNMATPSFSDISVNVRMGGEIRCSATSKLNVNPVATPTPPSPVNSNPWWQTVNGDVLSRKDITSEVPTGDYLLKDPSYPAPFLTFPGVAIYGNSGSLSYNAPNGLLSSKNWSAKTNTTYSRNYNYNFFKEMVPDAVRPDVAIDDTYLNDATALGSQGKPFTDGYEWHIRDNTGTPANDNLEITNPINLGERKVILFVKGNLEISNTVNLTDGKGFFLAIVGGKITINPPVKGSPSLEGLYLTDSNFSLEAGSDQFTLRGSLASNGKISLSRDLTDNTLPAEIFEFAPDQLLLFPPRLSWKRIRWAEIAP